MTCFALILDTGALRHLPSKVKTLDAARAALAENNRLHREGMIERERCRASGDHENFPLIIPRFAVALIKPKSKNRGAQYMGHKGGHARAASLSPERRSEIAKAAALKRWSKT